MSVKSFFDGSVDLAKVRMFSEYVRLNGAPAGSPDLSVNGSITPQEFILSPAMLGVEWLVIHRMLIHKDFSGNPTSQTYGDIAGPLANGTEVNYQLDGTIYHLDAGDSIKSNAEWAEFCFDVRSDSYGAGDNFLAVRWSVDRAGIPLLLRAHEQDKLQILIQDNLSTLVDHTVTVQGYCPRS